MQQTRFNEPATGRANHLALVTGATGSQGGATTHALLAAGHRVRVLARDPNAPKALALASQGAGIAGGEFDHTANFTRFDRANIELAAEALTMEEIASALSRGTRKPISARLVTPEQAVAAGLFAGWVRSQEWINEVGYRADIASLSAHGIPLTSFAQWIERHVREILIEH